MTIIGNHAHLMPPNSWREGSVDMLLKHMDFCGIDYAVVFPPFACQYNNSMEQANRWAWKQIYPHCDRLLAACTLFPLASNAVKMLKICSDEGIRLVKIHPSIDLYDISDPAATDFYAEAERLGIILDFHTGPHGTRLSLTRPEKFDNIAWDFPDLKLIFEHLGGRTYFEEFLAIINNHNVRRRDSGQCSCVFGGLTSTFSNVGEHLMWYINPTKLMELIDIVGADKLIFGIDFPWNDKQQTRKDIEIINSLDMPMQDKAKILEGNLTSLLGIEDK